MVSRSELRNIFENAIDDTSLGLTVFNGRHIDNLANAVPAAVIAFEEIQVDQDLSDGFTFSGTLSVLFLVKGDDNHLDSYVDPSIASIMARMRSQLPGTGATLDTIAYNRDIDPGIAAAVTIWTVTYV